MKKHLLLVLILSTFAGFSQDKPENSYGAKNEIKTNAIFLIVGGFDVSYERILDEESGVGASLSMLFGGSENDTKGFAFSPYYRFYFGEKPAAGFFMEGYGLYSSAQANYDYNGIATEKVSRLGLGIGLGGKWVTRRGILFEIGGGIGRDLSVTSNIPDAEYSRINGKFLITVGYRF